MLIALLILQAATLGVLVYVLLQIKTIFREVRNPVVRQKGSLSAEFKDRLRNLPRPDGQARDNRDVRPDRGPRPEGNRENRGDRGPREGNRENRGDRGPREGNRENRGDRGPRPEGNRENRGDRSPRPEGNRENRGDRGPREGNRENRGDRGPRPEVSSAPVAESASSEAPVAPAAAPVFQGRRPLNSVNTASSSESAVDSTPDALAPSSLAQPVSSDAPIRHGRRTLPKAKPRFDDDTDDVAEKETASA